MIKLNLPSIFGEPGDIPLLLNLLDK